MPVNLHVFTIPQSPTLPPSLSVSLPLCLTSDVLEEAERVCVLVPEELAHDDVGEGADEVHEAAVGGVVEPVVPRGRVVALELARRRVAKEDHLQQSRQGGFVMRCHGGRVQSPIRQSLLGAC